MQIFTQDESVLHPLSGVEWALSVTLGLTIGQVGLPYSVLNTVVPILCVWTWVYEPCEYFTSLQLLCKNVQKTWYRKFYMCAPLNLQYLEIFHSGTIKFTLYMCIYIVAKARSFLEVWEILRAFSKFLKCLVISIYIKSRVPLYLRFLQLTYSLVCKCCLAYL